MARLVTTTLFDILRRNLDSINQSTVDGLRVRLERDDPRLERRRILDPKSGKEFWLVGEERVFLTYSDEGTFLLLTACFRRRD